MTLLQYCVGVAIEKGWPWCPLLTRAVKFRVTSVGGGSWPWVSFLTILGIVSTASAVKVLRRFPGVSLGPGMHTSFYPPDLLWCPCLNSVIEDHGSLL